MWLFFALAAYTIFAGITITDKYLLARSFPDPRVYAFYTGILGLFIFALAPFFGFQIPEGRIIALGIFAGALFIAALFLFFVALRIGEVSRVTASLGGLIPFFTLGFVYMGTGDLPNTWEFTALVLLVGGGLLIMFEGFQKIFENFKAAGVILASAILFGLYFALAKFLFTTQPFVSAFLWVKIGGAIFALLFLFSPHVRKVLFEYKKSPPKKAGPVKKLLASKRNPFASLFSNGAGGIFIAKNTAGGLAALLQHLALSGTRFGEAALVNALQGFQFALVFLMAIFFTKMFPSVIKEEIAPKALGIKLLGLAFVVAGITVLAFAA